MSEAGADFTVQQTDISGASLFGNGDLTESAGRKLAAERVLQGLTVQQVAEKLKLSTRQILALEADQFELLPAMVIVRGFVRSYSKLLKMDPDAVVGFLPKYPENSLPSDMLRPAMATPFHESRIPSMARLDSGSRSFVFGAALLALLAIIFFVFQKYEKHWTLAELLATSTEHDEIKKEVAVNADLPDSSTASNNSASTVREEAVLPLVAPAPSQNSVQITAPETQAADALVANSESKASTPEVGRPDPGASLSRSVNILKLKFRQDSWVQIKRGNGAIVTSHMAKANSEETYDVNEELFVKIGNAAGVDGELRGGALEIPQVKGSNVANLIVK